VNAGDTSAAARLTLAVDRLVNQVGHWQQNRWSASRADRVHELVQQVADLAAEAEGEPCRAVPRLADLVLPDQLRVVSDDLVAAGAAETVLTAAAEAVDEARRAL
jgi:hypothetical protein